MFVDEAVLKAFGFYAALLVIKMCVMAFLTGKQRLVKKVFSNPEDTKTLSDSKINFNDQDVERVRRAHLNDMENIYLFFANAAVYILTGPSYGTALNLFRAFTAARYLHTFFYLNQIPQPTRGLAFATGHFINIYMAYCSLMHFW